AVSLLDYSTPSGRAATETVRPAAAEGLPPRHAPTARDGPGIAPGSAPQPALAMEPRATLGMRPAATRSGVDRWHATWWPPPTSSNGGSFSRQMGSASGQRV